MEHFQKFISEKYGMKVIFETHPIPQKYFITHNKIKEIRQMHIFCRKLFCQQLSDEHIRLNYD